MRIGLLFILTLFSSSLLAWDSSDFKAELLSPIETDAKWALISGVALTTTFAVLEDKVDPNHDEVVQEKPLGSFSQLGDLAGQMVPNALYMIYQWQWGKSERAQGMFKATMYATGWTTILKYTIREPRPNEHKDRNSFPSGHTATASAFASYVAAEHGWPWGIPAGVLAGFVGISRINDNRHRLHDVLAGATLGTIYGWGIRETDHQKAKKNSASFVPMMDTKTIGMAMFYEF